VADCDILDLSSLIAAIKKYRVKSVVHTALTKAALFQAIGTNCEGTANVLEAARLMDVERVTFTSSITVYYGITGKALCSEDTPIPIDVDQPIASEKISAEGICNLYAHEYGLNLIIVRPAMIYGPNSYSTIAPIPLILEKVLDGKKAVMPALHPDFSCDFLFVKDCSRAIGMVHLAEKPMHTIYNVAVGKNNNLGEVAAVMKKLVPGCEIELNGSAAPPWADLTMDVARIRDEFGYQPEYDLERGIREHIEWIAQGKP
jgi:UDP-glucose 4-epimerase